jgi:hypothetical protein
VPWNATLNPDGEIAGVPLGLSARSSPSESII